MNPRGELNGYRDLVVADSSVFPDSLALHPQVTVMAMADRIAGFIADR